jgi:dipeptidyl aminopeptidase/acylaminoacyl peptidase
MRFFRLTGFCILHLGALGLGLMAGTVMAGAQMSASSKAPTIDQSLETFSVNAPELSPDGKRVVYEQSRTNWENNSFDTELWIANADGSERHLLTVRAGSSSSAAWSADGKWIAFVSDRPGALKDSPGGKRQIYVMPADGGDAQQITKMENGVNGWEWVPDSKRIVFSAEGSEPKPMKDRKEYFGDYHVIHADYEMTHLWIVEVPQGDAAGRIGKTAEPKQLTKDEFSVGGFSVSPDGTRIAFSATRDPDLISGFSADIYTVAIGDGAVKKIVDTPGPDGNPKWSPDGKQIAYNTANGSKYFYYADQRIAVVPAEGGAPQVLTADFDEDPDIERWAPEGIYFSALQKTSSSLFLLDPTTKNVKKVEMPGSSVAGGFTFSKDFKTVAYRGAGENRFGEIYVSPLPATAPVQITHAGEQLAGFMTAHREVVRWKSGDGTQIEGVLYKPADFDAKKKYPLLVVIHGGPTGIDMPVVNADRYYPIERFVARGALVLRPNYRGSAGYGEAFRSLNVRTGQDLCWRRDSLHREGWPPQPGGGRLCGCDLGRGFADCAGICGQGPGGVDGVERGRLHFGVHYDGERPVQGGERGSRDIGLDDVLRQHRHHAVHAAVSACDAVG